MAMNIISKEKKEIKWIGLPTNSAQECQNLDVGGASFSSYIVKVAHHVLDTSSFSKSKTCIMFRIGSNQHPICGLGNQMTGIFVILKHNHDNKVNTCMCVTCFSP